MKIKVSSYTTPSWHLKALSILARLGLLVIGAITFTTILAVVNPQTRVEIKRLLTFSPPTLVYYPIKLYIDPRIRDFIPSSSLKGLSQISHNNIKRFSFVPAEDQAEIIITLSKHAQDSIYRIPLLPVVHFYSLKDNVSYKELTKVATLPEYKHIVATALPSAQIYTTDKLLNSLAQHKDLIGIIPFNELKPYYKLLYLSNEYFLDNPPKGSLGVYVTVRAKPKYRFAVSIIKDRLHVSNEDYSESILKVNMTGVTAITRGLAMKIEQKRDPAWPAHKIAKFLKSADLTHVSNEVSFVKGCRPTQGMRFCSAPKYAETLKEIGVDLIELTGNHNNDYGAYWNTWSIKNIYNKNHWEYFGGGLNKKDASKILYKKIKGTTLAFLGYNYYDTIHNNYHALATNTHAGANPFIPSQVKKDIAAAKKKADVVIVDVQFQECYAYPPRDMIYPICYRPLRSPDQRKVFRQLIDWGADIVIGTQAHQPQTFEIYKNKLIFYGLGNLFFDQINWIGTRQGLILTHYFYKGKHIQTKITTTLYDHDMQPYITTGKERQLLLKLLNQAR